MRRTMMIVTALVLGAGSVQASEVRFSGSLGGEMRTFVEQPQFPNQLEHAQPSLSITPEVAYDTPSGAHQFRLAPFLRLDSRDDQRTHVDIREAFWRYVGQDWEVLLGVNKVFWGVTESRHLVNIINQIDFVEDIDEEDHLGQPMLNLATQREWGRLDLFTLPRFRERTFPGEIGRLRFRLPVDTDAPEFESSMKEWHVDHALRYSHYIGDWDVGAYVFYGTGREPRFVPNANGTRLTPFYDLITQGGLDVQYTHGPWLWKFEGIVRDGQGSTFGAAVAGVEYTLFQVFDTAADLGLLFEYLYDGRDPQEAPVTFFEDDLFFGTRLAFNDIHDTAVLVGGIIDREDQSTALFVEAERRLGQQWKLELESRAFVNAGRTNPLSGFRQDSFITVRLSFGF